MVSSSNRHKPRRIKGTNDAKCSWCAQAVPEDWPAEDLEDAENCVVKPEAWEPVEAAFSQELTALIKQGVLEAKGKGASLKVKRESFYAWQGLDVPVLPEWGADYDVRPDSDAEALPRNRSDGQP